MGAFLAVEAEEGSGDLSPSDILDYFIDIIYYCRIK